MNLVAEIALKLVYFGIACGFASCGQTALFSLAGQRQAATMRRLYYTAILRQEMGWHDTQETGQLTTRISGLEHSLLSE